MSLPGRKAPKQWETVANSVAAAQKDRIVKIVSLPGLKVIPRRVSNYLRKCVATTLLQLSLIQCKRTPNILQHDAVCNRSFSRNSHTYTYIFVFASTPYLRMDSRPESEASESVSDKRRPLSGSGFFDRRTCETRHATFNASPAGYLSDFLKSGPPQHRNWPL